MKSIKIYLIVVSVLLALALSSGVYVWFVFQSTQSQLENERNQSENNLDQIETTTDVSAGAVPQIEAEPIIIQVDTLSETQQKTLNTFGFEGETITVTSAMISCAESAVGKDRFDDITAGASPSTLESLKLLPCFKK